MVLPIRISSSAALELVAAPSTRAAVIRATLKAPAETLRSQRLSLPTDSTLSNVCQRMSTTARIISPFATLLLPQPRAPQPQVSRLIDGGRVGAASPVFAPHRDD